MAVGFRRDRDAAPPFAAPPADTPLGEVVARLARQRPDAPAVTAEDGTLTWADLDRVSNRLARAYRDRGVAADDVVTVALPNGAEFVAAVTAVWKAGATPQPLSPRLPAAERDALLSLARPGLVVGGPAPDLDRAFASGAEVGESDLDSAAVAGSAPRAGPAAPAWVPAGFVPGPECSDAALPPLAAAEWKILASGGSTGRPKLIVARRPAVHGTVTALAGLQRMTPGGVHLATGPLSHNAPFFNAMCALMLGCHVVLMSRFRPDEALRLVARHRVDWMYAVPTMMQRIWRLPERAAADVSSLRTVLHLGAPCPAWLKRAWLDWLGPERVLEVYAATEVQALTVIDGREWLKRPGSVGRPAIGEIRVRDDAGRDVPPGTVGEVWMRRGPGEPPPYRYIGATARTAADGWESVGDMGRVDADGYLYLADRRADMILVGGSNVYPAEVEAALETHPAVLSACVVPAPDDDLGSVPHAVVQLAADVPDSSLTAYLRERLAGYKVPRSYRRVAEPLRDDAGKVRRQAWRIPRPDGPKDPSGPSGTAAA